MAQDTCFLLVVLMTCCVRMCLGNSSKRPNIIFFLTDDWGWNDVGYNGNTNTETPYIDNLAQNDGLILTKYYSMHLCSISRAALLTGRYPFRYGMQNNVLAYESKYALTLQETLLSQEFKSQGYSTHIIGKWHLGFLNWAYTPTYRGFDTFFGYYGGELYYNEHWGLDPFYDAIDIRDGTFPFDDPGVYSLYLWAREANNLIQTEAEKVQKSIKNINNINTDDTDSESNPFFLYLPWQGSHVPSEAVDSYFDHYRREYGDEILSNINETINASITQSRIAFQAQTTMTDQLFKSIVLNLKSTGLWDNTLIVFASDNGADIGHGDPSPLRGGKGTLWEGGIRVPAFITGGYLTENLRGKVFDSFPIHVTDWYPTLLAICGLKPVITNKYLDGKNVWNLLGTATKSSKRGISRSNTLKTEESKGSKLNPKGNESVKNVNENIKDLDEILIENSLSESEINIGKIGNVENAGNDLNMANIENNINANIARGSEINGINEFDGNFEEISEITNERVIVLNVNDANCNSSDGICGAIIFGGRWKLMYSNNEAQTSHSTCFWNRDFELSTHDMLGCGNIPKDVNTTYCNCENNVCLFDILNDPCEYYDVSKTFESITNKLYNLLVGYYTFEQFGALTNTVGLAPNGTIMPVNYSCEFIHSSNENNDCMNGNLSVNDVIAFWEPWDNRHWKELEFEHMMQQFNVRRSEREKNENNINYDSNYNINSNINDINAINNELNEMENDGIDDSVSENEIGIDKIRLPLRVSQNQNEGDSESNSKRKSKSDSDRVTKTNSFNDVIVLVTALSVALILCLAYFCLYYCEFRKQTMHNFDLTMGFDENSPLNDFDIIDVVAHSRYHIKSPQLSPI